MRHEAIDYHMPEGWNEYVKATAGSITDQTFVEPSDGYALDEE